MQFSLEGQGVVVTGGGRGIGAAITRAFLAEGARVLICGRREPEEMPEVDGRTAEFVAADVRDAEQAAHLIEEAVRRFGRLDIVVNNAGGGPPVAAAEMSPRLAQSVVNLNLVAPFFVAQAAYRAMAENGGHIINIGSVSSVRPAPGTSVYAAAKAGVGMLTRALALEFGPTVRVNSIVVGLVGTEHGAEHYGGKEGFEAVRNVLPAGRMAVAEDVGQACVALSSPALGYMSGAEIALDGGGETPAWYDTVQRFSAGD